MVSAQTTQIIQLVLEGIDKTKAALQSATKNMNFYKQEVQRTQQVILNARNKINSALVMIGSRQEWLAGAGKKASKGTVAQVNREIAALKKRIEVEKQRMAIASNVMARQRGLVSKAKEGINVLKEDLSKGKEQLSLAEKGIDVTQSRSKGTKGFFDIMRMSVPTYDDWNKQGKKNLSTLGKVADTTRNLTSGTKGFRMELLSVMFFGMMLQKTFLGLLQPAMQLSGIFDLFAVTLQVLFLPVAMALLEILMPIFEWFMDIPDSIKLVIGVVVLAIGVFGSLLFVIGSVGLGIGGLIVGFGTLVGVLLGDVVLPLSETILPAFGFLLVGISGLIFKTELAQQELKDGFSGFVTWITDTFSGIAEAIGGPIGGIVSVVGSVFGALVGLVTGESTDLFSTISSIAVGIGESILDFLGKMVVGIVEWLKTLPIIGPLIDIFAKAWVGVTSWLMEAGQIKSLGDAIDWVIRGIVGFAIWGAYVAEKLWTGINNWLHQSGTVEWITNTISWVIEAIKAFAQWGAFIAGKLWNALMDWMKGNPKIFEQALDWVIAQIDKFGEWGQNIAAQLVNGIIAGIKQLSPLVGMALEWLVSMGAQGRIATAAVVAPAGGAEPSLPYVETELTENLGQAAIEARRLANSMIEIREGSLAGQYIPSTVEGYYQKVGGGIVKKALVAAAREGVTTAGDFIWRPGQGLQTFNPSDTVVGFKGGEGAGTTNITPTYIINAEVKSDTDERALAERLNDLLTSDYRRLTYR